jgi:voltage-gated potassium channel
MSDFLRFSHFFFHAAARIWRIFLGLFAWLLVNAVATSYVEDIPFGDALYFSFITGLTIGYGDISPVTSMGRILAVLTGLVGILITGLVVAIAVYALRETLHDTNAGE